MATLVFGQSPVAVDFQLSAGADFQQALTCTSAPGSLAGLTFTLEITDELLGVVVYPIAVADPLIVISLTPAQVATTARGSRASIVVTNASGIRTVWTVGRILK